METLQLIGFGGLCYVNLNAANNNKNEQNFFIGSCLLSMGFILRAYEFYLTEKNNVKHKLSKGHLCLALFYLISFIYPINRRHTELNIIALVGHSLLINHNKYYNYGLLLLAIYYMIQIQENITQNDNDSKIRTISAICILTFYLQELKKINLIKKKTKSYKK